MNLRFLPGNHFHTLASLSLSHPSSRPSSFLSATPKMYKFQGNCPRYTIRTDNRDRSREIVGEREKPEKLGFTLDPIHRLFYNYARALAGLKNPRSRSVFEYRRGLFLSVSERCHLLRAKFPSSSSLRDPPSPMRKRWNNGKISIDRG